ncbi:hypothetical protein AALA98_12820 [Lachnospiraceae bacterium 45-W7]
MTWERSGFSFERFVLNPASSGSCRTIDLVRQLLFYLIGNTVLR